MSFLRLLVISLSLFFVLTGCATSGAINKVAIGMTKREVITAIGSPISISAQGNTEYLNYRFSETSDHAFSGITTPYYVRIVDGHVDSYGRTGDFDSTKTPTIRVENDMSIRASTTTPISNDLHSKLKELKSLKDNGLINSAEYESTKQKILNEWSKNKQ